MVTLKTGVSILLVSIGIAIGIGISVVSAWYDNQNTKPPIVVINVESLDYLVTKILIKNNTLPKLKRTQNNVTDLTSIALVVGERRGYVYVLNEINKLQSK